MGRGATGVKGIALRHGDTVVACLVLKEDSPAIMTISALGFGKRTNVDLYRVQSRGGKGDHQLQGQRRRRARSSVPSRCLMTRRSCC